MKVLDCSALIGHYLETVCSIRSWAPGLCCLKQQREVCHCDILLLSSSSLSLSPSCSPSILPHFKNCVLLEALHLYQGPLELYSTSRLGGASHNKQIYNGYKGDTYNCWKLTLSGPLSGSLLAHAHCRVPLPGWHLLVKLGNEIQ